AFAVAQLGGGLLTMRLLSAAFTKGSVPVIADLGSRLGGRRTGLTASVLASASWVLLFHGIYARMYSLFLFLSALEYLALLRAAEHGGRRAWGAWVAAILLTVAAHPYGALVLASQGLYVLLTRSRLKEAAAAAAIVLLLGIPFWRADLVLGNRFDVGVGGGGRKLGSLGSVLDYLYTVAGDYSAGWRPALIVVLLLALLGLVNLQRRASLLSLCALAVPFAFLTLGRFGRGTSPESRHLIFALPFFALAAAAGLWTIARRPLLVALALTALVPVETAWAWHKTPALFRHETHARLAARGAAAEWIAADARPNDVLFGYEPVYLAAWERARSRLSRLVIPRADAKLALTKLENADKPLGRGVWVFD